MEQLIKTNWKYIVAFLFLSIGISGAVGYYVLIQKPDDQKVEKVVYTKAAWDEDVGSVRRLIIANRDGTGRKVLLENTSNEFHGISSFVLLIPERNEAVVITQGRNYPYDIDIEKIHTETGKRTKLVAYTEGGIHGMSLRNAIPSPDKKKIALTIRKHLFIVDITKEKFATLKPFYTETQLRESEGDAIAPVFWDSLGNIYLKSFETSTGENWIDDFIKINSQGKREELSPEQKAFFQVSPFESQGDGFHLYPSPDGKFAVWIMSSEEGALSEKILVYSVEKKLWFIRLKKDSIQALENEEAIHFQKEKLGLPSYKAEIKGGSKEDIAGAQLYIDDVLIDSIGAISVGWGHGTAFEVLGFVNGEPISGWEKDSQEKARDQQEAEFQAFKKISLYPEYLPSGWIKEGERGHGLGSMLEFRNAKNDSLYIFQEKQDAQIPQEFYVFRDYVSRYPKNRIATQENVSIGSGSGLYFTGDYLEQVLAWSAEGLDIGISCAGSCSLKKEELIKIANSMKPITTVSRPAAQSQMLDISNWQTYRSDEFGFEVKYPREWFNNTDEGEKERYRALGKTYIFSNQNIENLQPDLDLTRRDLVVFFLDIQPGNNILIAVLDKLGTLQEGKEFVQVDPITNERLILMKVKDEFINGIPAVRYRINNGEVDFSKGLFHRSDRVGLIKNDLSFAFSLQGGSQKIVSQNQDVFEQILSTFRFAP